ncbi:GNAT family N-acetyltransferase [Streptomyces sp. NPDC088748]|uniref:GNAT family N-acetyltransferase n=1 Tax=Streptomyces sp. NPDC088748 TaxID=3365887 RepID=UPI0037FB075C
MTVMKAGPEAGVTVRAYNPQDREQVLALMDADRLPGRPTVSIRMLDDALAGICPDSGEPWGLEGLRTDVMASTDGRIMGVVSFAIRPADEAAVLLWLHCLEEDQAIAGALIGHLLGCCGRRTVYAFDMATALSFAGLPVGRRRGTCRALERAGFSRQETWSYLHHRLDTLRPRPFEVADLTESANPPGWRVRLRERDGTRIGEALVSLPVEGTTVLELMTLQPGRHTLGHILLEQCLAHLADRSVREIVTLRETPPDSEAQHDPVRHLHLQAGFREIDQLHTYTRRP